MEAWLAIVMRQIILYSLPVVVSLSLVGMLESAFLSRKDLSGNPFRGMAWQGAWLPFAASILFGRAVIIALPQPASPGPVAAFVRLSVHLVLCLAGWLLYALALAHAPDTGLPPLHQWWAKVLMFFNLCMACLHLLPLPGMLVGEWLSGWRPVHRCRHWMQDCAPWLFAVLAASPVLDLFPGQVLIFRIYEVLATQAAVMAR